MTFSFLGPDPLEQQIETVLGRVAAGEPPSAVEVAQVDVKEEKGRRGPGGVIIEGATENEAAATYLCAEMACLANTPGGGAIILGIADDGQRIGTELDPEWLRHRIWQLTEQKLTITVRVATLDNVRILVLTTHEAMEPVPAGGKLTWRVDDHCVDVDPTTWHSGHLQRSGVDWSAMASGHMLADLSPTALEVARRYLTLAGDEPATDLAAATDADLLRRLHLVDGDGRLTNAGSLLFVATPAIGLDYIRRDAPGADSTLRVRSDRSLLEQVWDVDQASQASNRVVHIAEGIAHGQLRAIPMRAVREAIVNGVVHRDWLSPQPTVVEHVGDMLTVTSPGGFIGGVSPTNIITHPAVPRYRSLAEAMAALRLAEREGIGVDRMVRDMLAVGQHEPEISELDGPYVHVGLAGGEPDAQVIDFLREIEPPETRVDVDALLVLDHLTRFGWADVATVSPVLQRPAGETQAALLRLAHARCGDESVIVAVKGVPTSQPTAYQLGPAARAKLAGRVAHLDTPEGRTGVILGWAQARKRVSTTEVASLTGLSVPYVGGLLNALEDEGALAPGRQTKQGRGFFYVPA